MIQLIRSTTWEIRIVKDSIKADHRAFIRKFMQRTESHKKSTDAAIRNLEVQMGQLAQKIAKGPTKTFGANTEKNPKEECKAIVTRSQK
ncbi:hypothetical protein GmHk_03G007385 [Glycine max]|nr:hypothetical protein GmHk_03G007385 [Glycine max]